MSAIITIISIYLVQILFFLLVTNKNLRGINGGEK